VIRTACGTKRSTRFKSGAHSIDDCRLSTGHDAAAFPAARRVGAALEAASRCPVGQPRLASIGEDAGTARNPVSRPRGLRREGFAQRTCLTIRRHVATVARCDRALPGGNRQREFAGNRDSGDPLAPREERAAGVTASGIGHDRDREIPAISHPPLPRSGLPRAGRAKSSCRSALCQPRPRRPTSGADTAPERSRKNGQRRLVVLRSARPGSSFTTKGIE
jgi:hypothetical protein